MIELSHVSVSFSSTIALNAASCQFPMGTTALVGRNGAGKTTLLKVLCGLIRPDEGTVRVGGRNPFADATSTRDYRSSLSWVPQAIDLPKRSRVGDFVRYCGWLGGIAGDARVQARSALGAVELEKLTNRRIGTLSGGEQRRVMVACALITDPTIVILDEPTAGLDPDQRDHLHDVLNAVAQSRTTIVSTHLMEDVLGLAAEVVVLDAGRVTIAEPLETILEKTRTADPRAQVRSLREYLYRSTV